MSIEKVEMFTVVCDNCGKSADEGTDFSCWNDENHASEVAMESGFIKEGILHYCPECFDYDDDDQLTINADRKKKVEKKETVEFLTRAEIQFAVMGIDHHFTVYHNLEKYHLLIGNALESWVFRTKKFTKKSFCEYVMSKGGGIVCMGEKQFNRLFN